MELHKLVSQTALHEELSQVWATQGNLDEGLWDSMKSGFSQIANTVTTVKASANTKGELNDKVLRQIYVVELKKFKDLFDKAPAKIKPTVEGLLEKAGIRLSGADVSRENLNRILVLKVLRLVLFAINQLRDNGVQWFLSTVVTAGIGSIIGLLMNAKDAKDVAKELVNTSKQLKLLFDKANLVPAK